MSLLQNVYYKSISETQQQIHFWEDHLKQLKSLDLSIFSDKLSVPILVPIGKNILFRGDLIHTNEVMVAIGADYFVKCSSKQADILRQHRISIAEAKLNSLIKESEYLEKQIFFKSNNAESVSEEIIEPYDEEEDKLWRAKHKDNIRIYKQKARMDKSEELNITDNELWQKLEELELQEELNDELNKLNDEAKSRVVHNEVSQNVDEDHVANQPLANHKLVEENNKPIEHIRLSTYSETIHKAMDKRGELETKFNELKNRDRKVSKTERDLEAILDELEELDELEDEMNRLDLLDELEGIKDKPVLKQNSKVSFERDNEDCETLELTFSHSNVEPDTTPYNPEVGIRQPSDIYHAFNLIDKSKNIKSILKKKVYPIENTESLEGKSLEISKSLEDKDPVINIEENRIERNTIVLKDIKEKNDLIENIVEESKRPPSLFKMKRLQKK